MIKKIFLAVFVLSIALVSCKEDPAEKVKKDNAEMAKKRDYEMKHNSPVMEFSTTEHDFGTINEGDVVETTFTFKNTGKSELIITNARASCGCTIPEWPKEPIMPGAEGKIKVKFNSKGKPHKQQKKVTLTTNTYNGTEYLTIKANVNPKK